MENIGLQQTKKDVEEKRLNSNVNDFTLSALEIIVRLKNSNLDIQQTEINLYFEYIHSWLTWNAFRNATGIYVQ